MFIVAIYEDHIDLVFTAPNFHHIIYGDRLNTPYHIPCMESEVRLLNNIESVRQLSNYLCRFITQSSVMDVICYHWLKGREKI